MSESQVAQIPKPKLRGLLHAQIKTNLSVAIALTIISGISWKFLVADRRKQQYANFYKNYDAEKEFERMRKLGLFQSCSPDDE